MALQLRQTRTARLLQNARDLRASILDLLYSPAISRLTTDEYFSCRTRDDCLRTYLRRRIATLLG